MFLITVWYLITADLCIVLGEKSLFFHWLQLDEGLVDDIRVVILVKSHQTGSLQIRGKNSIQVGVKKGGRERQRQQNTTTSRSKTTLLLEPKGMYDSS